MQFIKRKLIPLLLFCSVLMFGIALGITVHNFLEYQSQMPLMAEIKQLDNNSKLLSKEVQDVVYKSRSSTVKVLSISFESNMFSSTTGTYFVKNDRHFVLTVNHGIPGECKFTKINVDGQFLKCKRFIELNSVYDYAIIEIDEEIENRIPVHILSDLPFGREWKSSLSILGDVYYSGFPNNVNGPLTIKGRIAGYAPGGLLYVHSYAWSGSSGSGVFTSQGEFIGYIVAIDIGQTEYGIDIMEDIVLVAPIYNVDFTEINDDEKE